MIPTTIHEFTDLDKFWDIHLTCLGDTSEETFQSFKEWIATDMQEVVALVTKDTPVQLLLKIERFDEGYVIRIHRTLWWGDREHDDRS
jgi:hypothetical protein